MSKNRFLVVGVGGYSRSVAETAELSDQFQVVGFLDDAGQLVQAESALG